jgi:hypothetical protein
MSVNSVSNSDIIHLPATNTPEAASAATVTQGSRQNAAQAASAATPVETPAERLNDILRMYGFKASGENRAMLQMLLDNGLPLTKDNITRMNQAVKLTESPEQALFLLLNNIRLTQANAGQLRGLVEGQFKITEQLNRLLAAVESIDDPALREQILRLLENVNGANAPVRTANVGGQTLTLIGEGAEQTAQTAAAQTAATQGGTTAQAQATQTSAAQGGTQTQAAQTSATQGSTQAQAAQSTAQTPDTQSGTATQQAVHASDTQGGTQAQAVQTSAEQSGAQAQATQISQTPQTAATQVGTTAQPGVASSNQASAANTNGQAAQSTAPAVPGQSTQSNIPATSEQATQPNASAESRQSAQTATTVATQQTSRQPAQPNAISRQLASETAETLAALSSEDSSVIHSNLKQASDTVSRANAARPSFRLEDSGPQDIDRFINSLRDALTETRRVIETRPEPSQAAERVLREAQTLSEHIDFTAQIKNQLFVQLPVYHNGQDMQTALHVYKDASKKGGKGDGTASALIALDTLSLGHFETYVQKSARSVSCQFRLDNKRVENLVRAHIHELNALLSEYRYSLDAFTFLPKAEPYTVLNSPGVFGGEDAALNYTERTVFESRV